MIHRKCAIAPYCLTAALALLAAGHVFADAPTSPSQPATRPSVALLDAEYITTDAQTPRGPLTVWLDAALAESLGQQKHVVPVEREDLGKILAEKTLQLAQQSADAHLKPFLASGVLICPTITAQGSKAVVTIQAVVAQSGALLAETTVIGELSGDAWKTPPALSEPLAVFWTDLHRQLAANLGRPTFEVSRINLTSKLERLQWLADDLSDSLSTAPHDGLVFLMPVQPLHTKEERLLRLMGLSTPADADGSAKLAAASDCQLAGDLAEQLKPGTPFEQTPITLALRLTAAGKTVASTTFTSTVGDHAKLQQQAMAWATDQLGLAVHAPLQPLDESHARALAQQELITARRLTAINYGTSNLESDRQERLAMAALRACHLDPTSEEAAYLAAITIEGHYQARGQNGTLACKDRILQLGQQYMDRFGDKVAAHHRAILAQIGSAGQSAAFILRGTPGGTSAITGPPDERQYPYANAYVQAWMEAGIRGATDQRYDDSNALQSAPIHLRLHLIPNIPDDKLDEAYTFWHDLWTKRVAPLGAGKGVPWESIDVAFQARRKRPAAVRVLLQRLADKYPASDATIWRLLRDDIVPLYLQAAGDKESSTWRPTCLRSTELLITAAEAQRFYARYFVQPPPVCDLSRSTPLPFDHRLVFDGKVLDTGRRECMYPYPRIEALFVAGGDLWLITPGRWIGLNANESPTLFATPSAAVTGPQQDLPIQPRAIPWPASDSHDPSAHHITCWLADPAQNTVWIGTAGNGIAIFTKDQGAWQGRWRAQHDGLPAGSITSVAWEKKDTLLRVEGVSPEVTRKDEQGHTIGIPREPWALRFDTTHNTAELLPKPMPQDHGGYTQVTLTPQNPAGVPRVLALQTDQLKFADPRELRQLDPRTGKPLPGTPTLGTLNTQPLQKSRLRAFPRLDESVFLTPDAPLHNTRMAASCGDRILLASYWLPPDGHLPNTGEATHLTFYRPAPADAPHPSAADLWVGPFLSPDHGPIFAVLNDGLGNVWLTTDQAVYHIAISTLLPKLPAGQSTDEYRATYLEQRKHFDWRVQVCQSLAEDRTADALQIVQDTLAPLATVDAASPPERRDDWAVAMLYQAAVFAGQDKSLPQGIAVCRQVLDTPWANPAARKEAALALLKQLHLARRWQELLDAAETIRPLFPHLLDESDPTSWAWYIKDARAQLKPNTPGKP